MGLKRSVRVGTAGVIAVLVLAACGPAASSVRGSTAVPAATAHDVNGIHRVYVQPKLIQGTPGRFSWAASSVPSAPPCTGLS